MSVWLNHELLFPERAMSRRFLKRDNTYQNVDVCGIWAVRSAGECSVICTVKAQECVGFNFKRGPPIVCELCSVPHDAPNADMVDHPDWDHYAIVP